MKTIRIFLCAATFFIALPHASPANGQAPNLNQSSSSINWRMITNSFVRVVYPDYMEATGNQVANLIEHYSHVVGLSYGIEKPKQITIILRPQMALPNGFVTLTPRRSEWFCNATLTPFVGGLDFNQALSIHEYRHVNQFDFLNHRMNRVLYYLFGEGFLGLADSLGVPPWFFEGDAVWAETVKTDAGRGRSPRFAARLKAMLASGQVPTFDQMIGGTYNTVYPDHYVYGYFLVTRAYRLYGNDIWARVLRRVTGFPLNPYLVFMAFKSETGKYFEDYYKETMAELATAWQGDFKEQAPAVLEPYTVHDYPIVDEKRTYYLKKTLDSYWGLYTEDNGSERLVRELNIMPDESRLDIKHGKVVFTQVLPGPRFGYQEFSDLFIYDIASDTTTRISEERRYYHPQFSPDQKQLLAIEFDSQNTWHLAVLDPTGIPLRSVSFENRTINEAVWQDDRSVFAIMQDLEGYRSIVKIDTVDKTYQTLMGRTRNNIFALNYAKGQLYFEADDKGSVQVFQIGTASLQLARCTAEPIAAMRPFVHDRQISFVSQTANGSKIVRQELHCSSVPTDSLVDFHYLGHTPSDDFTGSKPELISDYPAMVNQKHTSEEYNELDGGLKPHSWSFIGGRGFQLAANATNYLGTLNLQAGAGIDAEEGRPWQSLQLDYMKYYPVLSLQLANRDRKTTTGPDDNQTQFRWHESAVSTGIALPYLFSHGFYHGRHEISLGLGYLVTSQHDDAPPYDLNNERIVTSSINYSFAYLKQKTSRDIFSPLGVALTGVYESDAAQRRADFSSWIRYARMYLFVPGWTINHGQKLSYSDEQREAGLSHYRRKSFADEVGENVFSRGYGYHVVDRFDKATYDYAWPLLYPDADVDGWVYLRRLSADLFYDYTRTFEQTGDALLRSTGAELLFDIYLLRKLPLTFGWRLIVPLPTGQKLSGQGFLATSSEF